MNPLGTRGRAQQFADLLDSALSGPLFVADGTGAFASYVGIATHLQAVGTSAHQRVAPRAEFRDQLRTRLMAVAAVQAHQAPARSDAGRRAAAPAWTPSPKAQRGLSVAAGAMASVVAVTGVAVAGSQSLPGDPFYGVKKGIEAFALRTADGPVDKGSKHLELAQERLSEVRGLTLGRDAALGPLSTEIGAVSAASALGTSTTDRVRQALGDMDAQTREGSDLLTQAYRQSNSDVPLQILTRFAGKQSSQLRALLPALPAAARLRGEASLAYVSGVAARSSELLAIGVCTGACQPSTAPPALPPVSGQPQPQPQSSAMLDPAPCSCPQPTTSAAAEPTPQPTGTADPRPEPTSAPSPRPTASSSSAPLPVPVPVPTSPAPVPSPPIPLPTPTTLPAPPTLPAPTALPALPTLLSTGFAQAGSDTPALLPGTSYLDLLTTSMPSLLRLTTAAPTGTSQPPTASRASAQRIAR